MAVTEAALGRRERKKRETRRALASAALRLASERGGPDQVTIEEIAEAADVSIRTFFNYFSSKEEAIIGWDPDGRAEVAAKLLGRPAEEPPLVAMRNVVHDLIHGAPEWADERALRHRLVREHPSLLPRHLAAHYELERSLLHAMAQRHVWKAPNSRDHCGFQLGLEEEVVVRPTEALRQTRERS